LAEDIISVVEQVEKRMQHITSEDPSSFMNTIGGLVASVVWQGRNADSVTKEEFNKAIKQGAVDVSLARYHAKGGWQANHFIVQEYYLKDEVYNFTTWMEQMTKAESQYPPLAQSLNEKKLELERIFKQFQDMVISAIKARRDKEAKQEKQRQEREKRWYKWGYSDDYSRFKPDYKQQQQQQNDSEQEEEEKKFADALKLLGIEPEKLDNLTKDDIGTGDYGKPFEQMTVNERKVRFCHKVFKRLAFSHHPDKSDGSAEDMQRRTEKMKELGNAFDILMVAFEDK